MQDRLLSPKATADIVSLSPRSIRRLVLSGDFPSPVQLTTQRIAYSEAEVNQWVRDKLKASGKEPSKRILSFETETPDQGLTAPDPVQLESQVGHADTYSKS